MMSWMQQNKFMAGFLAFMVLALGGAGYYLGTGHSKYKAAIDKFEGERNRLTSLKGRPLFPKQDNVDVMEEAVGGYKGSVTELQQELLKFQKPLNTSMQTQQFPQKLKAKIAEFQKVAEINGVELPQEFYMGFPTYRVNLPRNTAVSLLDYELDAISHMLNLLAVDSGVKALVELKRESLPIEAPNYKAPDDKPVLEKYPMELTFTSSHAGVQNFFNRLSNDEEYFYIIRFIRVENSSKQGPSRKKDQFAADSTTPFVFPSAGEDDDIVASSAEAGGGEDATIILGKEDVQVYAVVDLVRFEEVAMAEEKTSAPAPAGEGAEAAAR